MSEEAARTGWRSWFPSTGQPPACALVRYMAAVLLAGAPTGAIGDWAGRRVLDTAIGCAIALVATYLLWPRDDETDEPVPVTT